jgi:hypothetical protein
MRITVSEIFYCNHTVLESSNTDGTTVHRVLLYGTTSSAINTVILIILSTQALVRSPIGIGVMASSDD